MCGLINIVCLPVRWFGALIQKGFLHRPRYTDCNFHSVDCALKAFINIVETCHVSIHHSDLNNIFYIGIIMLFE